jgi:hypothetical protein
MAVNKENGRTGTYAFADEVLGQVGGEEVVS